MLIPNLHRVAHNQGTKPQEEASEIDVLMEGVPKTIENVFPEGMVLTSDYVDLTLTLDDNGPKERRSGS